MEKLIYINCSWQRIAKGTIISFEELIYLVHCTNNGFPNFLKWVANEIKTLKPSGNVYTAIRYKCVVEVMDRISRTVTDAPKNCVVSQRKKKILIFVQLNLRFNWAFSEHLVSVCLFVNLTLYYIFNFYFWSSKFF